MTFKIQSL